MPNGKQKLVMVPGTGVVAFPGDMEDEHVAAAIRAFRSQKAADQAAKSHLLNRPQPLTTEESEHARQLKAAQPLSSAIPHLPAWLNTPSTELGRQTGNWLSGEIGKVLGTKLPDIEPGAVGEQEADQFRQAHPIAGGVAHGISDMANSLTTPASMALLMTAPESKLMSGLFSLQALHGAYKDAQAAREAYRQGNNEEATRYATESILGGAMGLAAGAHAVTPARGPQGEILPPEARPQPELPSLPPSTPVTLEGKTGGFALPEYDEAPVANYQLIYKSPAASPEELNRAVSDLVKARESKGWSDPNATPEETKAAQRDFYSAADRLGKLKQQSVGQIRQIPSGEKIVYLTDAGLHDLHAGLRGRAPDPEYSLNGVSIAGRYIPIVQTNLAALNTPHSKELTKLLSMGAGPDGTVTVSAVPTKNETLSNALSRLREELNHGWQKQFSDAMGNHLLPSEFESLNQAIPDAMGGYLRQNGYPEDSGDKEANRMRVLEASAKMMSGAPSEFGLTPDEAANYLFQYFDAITKAHGPKALDELVHTTTLARNIKKDYANARYPSRGSQSPGTLPGLPAGGQGRAQEGLGAPGRGTAPVAGPPAQAGAAAPSVNLSRSAIEKVPDDAKQRYAERVGEWLKRAAEDTRAADTLDQMEAEGESPQTIAKQFWDKTYFQLPEGAQSMFRSYVRNLWGAKPGDVIGTNANGEKIIAKDWLDLADKLDLPDDPAHLQGTERGYVVLMREANRRFGGIAAAPSLAALRDEAALRRPSPVPGQTANLSYVSADESQPFYLKSDQIIDQKMKGPMSGPQILQMLRNSGVKEDELETTGLSDLLSEDRKFTPQEVKEFAEANPIQIEEISTGANPPTRWKPEDIWVRRVGDAWIGRAPDLSERVLRSDVPEERAKEELAQLLSRDYETVGKTKYGQYTEPGGPLSKDTEILTDHGWENLAETPVGTSVLTRKDDGQLEWQPILAKTKIFAESLYHFSNRSVDMMVTGNHQMIVSRARKHRQKIFRTTAERLWKMSECMIPLTGTPISSAPETLFGLDAGDVAEFVGWYLSEGSYKQKNGVKNTIQIAQERRANGAKCDRLESLISRLGFSWKYYGGSYGVGIKSMPKELVSLLHMQPTSQGKYVPALFFRVGFQIQERLLEGLILGDGHTSKARNGRLPRKWYFSKSEKLAGDVQALAVLTGQTATVIRRKTGLYAVGFNHRRWSYVDDAKRAIVGYKDYAHCVTVENHSIYVRRKGIAGFTGNSNYREILMTFPNTRGPKFDPSKLEIKRDRRSVTQGSTSLYYDGKLLANYGDDPTLQPDGSYRQKPDSYWQGVAKDIFQSGDPRNRIEAQGGGFRSGHWDEPNVLVHIRANDRTLPDGRKVLHVEEIQSDMMQSMRKQRKLIENAVNGEYFYDIIKGMQQDGKIEVKC